MPGLYDLGYYVDSLENQHLYFVEELTYATDKNSYMDTFFITPEEKDYSIKRSLFVSDIEKEISFIIQ